MKFSFFLITLVILSACTINTERLDETTHIQALEKQVAELQQENANLRNELDLAKQGGIQDGMNIITGSSLFPEGTTFEESSDVECIQQAKDKFVTAGNKKCQESGYSDEDIANGKCQLKKETITELNTMRSNEESLCNSLYK